IIGFAFIIEFLTYALVRQIVNLVEWLVEWRGYQRTLRQKLSTAKDYNSWKSTALELDEYLGYDRWKRSSSNAYYDSPLVRRVIQNLKELREKDDVIGIKEVLEVCVRNNFAGIESSRLYSETHFGTKTLIEVYTEEVERCLSYLRQTTHLSQLEKYTFFRRASKNFGTSALCLSGGASFGYYHFGVIRALLDVRLIPRVVTGTSAGALIAAFLCTHTEEELDRFIVPELADMITACSEPITAWVPRLWRTGAQYDTVTWAKKLSFFTMGSMTFLEAYERTGRILNISVIPFDIHSPTKLLNYITAPNCVIFSAVLASAAVPGVLNPVVLLEKIKDGSLRPWQFQGKHKDGSLRVDVPLESLHLYFNTSFSIVSQVNPHIHIFFFQPRGAPGTPVVHRSGKGWRGGFLLSALEQLLKIELTKNFRVIRDLELLPESGGQSWSAVFLQKFEGSITIWPKSTFKDWLRILSDPSREELGRMIDVGKRVTWPKLHMIENRLRLERQIVQGREETRDFKTSHNSERRSSPLPNHEFQGADLPLTIPSPPSLEIEEEIAESITDQEGEEGEVTFEKVKKLLSNESDLEREDQLRKDRMLWRRLEVGKSEEIGKGRSSGSTEVLKDPSHDHDEMKDGRMGSGKKGLGLPRKVKLAVLKADTSTDSEDQWSSEY
ncbi:acyl transferase/acyl hydrolase/lysophospholipase, partial [Melampsora americana]